MRKITTTLLLCFLVSTSVKAQGTDKLSSPNPAPLLTEVSIGIPNLKNEQFGNVKTALLSIPGIKWAGYCEDQHYVFLFVNRTLVPDNETISNAILSVNNELKLYYKTASLELLLNNCRDKEKAMKR